MSLPLACCSGEVGVHGQVAGWWQADLMSSMSGSSRAGLHQAETAHCGPAGGAVQPLLPAAGPALAVAYSAPMLMAFGGANPPTKLQSSPPLPPPHHGRSGGPVGKQPRRSAQC